VRYLRKFLAYVVAKYYCHEVELTGQIDMYLECNSWRVFVSNIVGQLCYLTGLSKCYIAKRVVRFEVSNVCNLQCKMCPQPVKMTRQKMLMDINLFKQVIDANPYIENVELFNWGEPLLHPHIIEFVKYCSIKKIKSHIVTNGVRMTPMMAKELIDAGLTRISFSLDDVGDNYTNIRGYPYGLVIDNIEKFIGVVENFNANMILEIYVTESIYNQGKVKIAVERLKKLIVDAISVYPCVTNEPMNKRDMRCPELYRKPIILSNGDIVSCCADYDGVLKFGSVMEEPNIKKLYNNDIIQNIRKMMKKQETMPKFCSYCNYAKWGI